MIDRYLEFVQECGTEADDNHAITSGNARTLIEAWNFQYQSTGKYDLIYDSWKGSPYDNIDMCSSVINNRINDHINNNMHVYEYHHYTSETSGNAYRSIYMV